MNWWQPFAALAAVCVAFVAVGSLVRLAATVTASTAALAVVALVTAAVLAAARFGSGPVGRLSNPYW
jgi:hypothetical protein